MQFAAPVSGGDDGPRFKPAEHEGRLLLVEPIAYKENIETQSGPADAIECSVVDLDANEEYPNALLFGVALRNSLKTQIGEKVLARLGKGEAKAGKNAAWILIDATQDAAAIKKATDYLAGGLSKPVTTPTVDVDAIDPAILALLKQQMDAQKIS